MISPVRSRDREGSACKTYSIHLFIHIGLTEKSAVADPEEYFGYR